MPEAELPPILFTFDRVACSRHGEPFRERWPEGWVYFTLALFEAFVQKQEIIDWAGGATERLGLAIQEFGPLCCYLGREDLMAGYKKSRIGRNAVCTNCDKWALGTPYRTADPDTGETLEHEHICFGCVLDWMRPAEP